MNIMHIADLHIGRTINQQSLHEDQHYILQQLINEIDREAIELVMIAGDIYDRSVPSKEAVQLFEYFLTEINMKRNIPVLAVSGNHDGAARLGYGKAWFRQHGFYLSTHIEDSFEPVQINNIDFYLIPYIEPAEARLYFEDERIKTHADTYERIINEINCQQNDKRKHFVISHLFIQNGKESDSERPVSIGTIEYVNEAVFKDFDYVALGHLHHPFAIQSEQVFYSGSPLKYSFSEVKQPKGYRKVTVGESIQSTFIPLQPLRDMEEITATFDDVWHDRLNINKNNYLKFTLSGLETVTEPMARLKKIYPNLLELRYLRADKDYSKQTFEMREQSDMEIISQFIETMEDQSMSQQQIEIIQSVLEEVIHETD